MKKLLVLSGKGGTGKTTVASALIHLLEANTYADCDVDAPNLHITATPKGTPIKKDYYGMPKAVIDVTKCKECKQCISVCKFDAITRADTIQVNPFACEGCGVCEIVCKVNAITMEPYVSGQTYTYHEGGVFSTAKLRMGAGASGKLVSEVKKNMGTGTEGEIAVIDGSPGIGCPVIASMSGVTMVLIVTEPTVSGMSDLQRILETARYFRVACAVCINKYDINPSNTEKIRAYCKDQNIEIVGLIPFDKMASVAINQGKSIVEMDCDAGRELKVILDNTLKIIGEVTHG